MMTNKPHGTLCIGVTADLVRDVHEDRTHLPKGFTHRCNLARPVRFEAHDIPREAIRREKALKRWNRALKLDQITASNPGWRDLWPQIVGSGPTMTAKGAV